MLDSPIPKKIPVSATAVQLNFNHTGLHYLMLYQLELKKNCHCGKKKKKVEVQVIQYNIA